MSPLVPNSSYVLKTGATDGSQVFERLPLGATVIGTDENGNPIDSSDKIKTDLNYVSHASLVYEGTQIQDTQYYQNPAPPVGPLFLQTFSKPVGIPHFYFDGSQYQVIAEMTTPPTITYDENGYITAPLDGGYSLIYDEFNRRIDQKIVHLETYFDVDGLKCNKPIKDVDGRQSFPIYDLRASADPNLITNEIYDFNGKLVVRREVSNLNTDAIAALNVEFNVADDWVEGDIKQFYVRSLMKPIKMNASTYYGDNNADLKKAHGRVILTVETEEKTAYIFLESYADNHILPDESALTIDDRAYVIRIDLRRIEDLIHLISCEYRIPYYYSDDENEIYKQGEFTFKTSNYKTMTCTINGSGTSSELFYPSTETAYTKVTLNIGSEWSQSLVGATDCWAYYNLDKLDESGESDMHLTIKTFSNVTDSNNQ